MLHIQNICDYLKIFNDEVKDFVVINFDKYFKSAKEELYPELCEEQNLRKIVEYFYVFLT